MSLKREKNAVSKEELLKLSKEDLIEHIMQLHSHNSQLKNIIKKRAEGGTDVSLVTSTKFPKRSFDFSMHKRRHILLRILYLGWDYQGYAVQEDTINTIEHYLFAALTKACLIENRQTSNYHRCGRTDKGVSSFGQVISIDIRSKLSEDYSVSSDVHNELHYCKILNRLLPEEIRAVAWRPVPKDFSARFDCSQRVYKYYFPRDRLDLSAMAEAANYAVGTHDFRNICKMDVGNGVVNYVREIRSADIQPCLKLTEPPAEFDMMVFTLVGSAFIWHQVRCLFGLLLLVGQKQEDPKIVLELLNIEQNPRKPQYSMANEVPLNLFHCQYPLDESGWLIETESLTEVWQTLQRGWTFNAIKASMIQDMLSSLSNMQPENPSQFQKNSCLLQGVKSKVYKPLLSRPTCESLESRIKHYSKKRKIDLSDNTKCDSSKTEDMVNVNNIGQD